MLSRCGARAHGALAASEVMAWSAPKASAPHPNGDLAPDPPVPPGRRYPGGPDRGGSGEGEPIPATLHLALVEEDLELQGRWQAYAEDFGFILRVWTLAAVPDAGSSSTPTLLTAVHRGLGREQPAAVRAALARGLGLAMLAGEGGALVGRPTQPPRIDLRRLIPWRNAAIIASARSPSYRGLPDNLHRLDPHVSEVLIDSGRGRALGSNATAVYPGFLAASAGHRWIEHLARQTSADILGMLSDGQLPAGLVLSEAALSRSLGGPITLIPMRLAVHAGLVGQEPFFPAP